MIISVFLPLLGNRKMMSPFFLLNFSDLDLALKLDGRLW